MTNSVRLIVIATSALTIFLLSVSMLDLITNTTIQKEQVQIFHPLKVAYVSAADEGSLRCTDGKLAASQDQCPATDRCPPPQNNTVSNCVSEAASNSTLASPDGQATTNNETAASRDGQATTNNETAASPDGQATTNNETTASPDGQATTNNETAASPDGQATTNNETAASHCLDNRFTLHTPQCTDSSSSPENVTLPR